MSIRIQVTQEEEKSIIKALHAFFPNAKIYVFGSRVHGSAKKYSDLDIALDDGEVLDFVKFASLKEFFAESQLPYKVDISDFQTMDKTFRELVLKTSVRW